MQIYATLDFIIGCAIWVAIISFILGFFIGAFVFKSK